MSLSTLPLAASTRFSSAGTARDQRSVLLLANAYPPYPASGALRPEKVVRALRDRGHRVHVITARQAFDHGRYRVREPGLEVHAVRAVPHPRHLYLALKRAIPRRRGAHDGAHPPPAASPMAVPPSYPAWKRYLLSMLLLPDDQQGFVPAAVLHALPMLRRGVDLLYTTGPAVSTHMAGLLLKRLTGVSWAAEFRDLWTQGPDREATRHLRSRGSVAIERWLERRILLDADHVVAVSRGIRDCLAQRLDGARHERFVLARNGIATLRSRAQSPSAEQVRALYLGGLGQERDPRPLLRAVAALRARGLLTPERFALDLVGDCDWYKDVSMNDFIVSLGLADMVRVLRWVPHAVGQDMTDRADLLILLAQSQPAPVPNKLYEYLGSRKPILAFADDWGESADLLREAGGHYVITEHDARPAIERAILEVLDARMSGRNTYGDESVLSELTTDRQMALLMDALGC